MKANAYLPKLALAAGLGLFTAEASVHAAPAPRPAAGKEERFPDGLWSGLPQTGPDGKVQQCVLVAKRERAGKDGPIDTQFAIIVSRATGLAINIGDDRLPGEDVLDDQAEIVIDGRKFAAVGFPLAGSTFAMHPGDAAGALAALSKAKQVTLRSDGADVDTGPITIDLPAEPLTWLKRCGQMFSIAIDRPTDPNAPALPRPRPRSPRIASPQWSAAGPAGIQDRQMIAGWEASELRGDDGTIAVCLIRRHYASGPDAGGRQLGTFLMVSRAKGLTMMLKDSELNLTEGEPVEATLTAGSEPFTEFSAYNLGTDEIGVFPQHGLALAKAIDKSEHLDFKSKPVQMKFPIAGAMPWLRACARRNGLALEPGAG